MIQKTFAFFWSMFFTILVLVSLVVLGLFFDKIGIITIPQVEIPTWISDFQSPIQVSIVGVPTLEKRSLLPSLPTSSPLLGRLGSPTATLEPTPTPLPTIPPPTEIPPLDPAVYQAEVSVRLKNYAAVLQQWLDANQKLSNNGSLFNDPSWQAEMRALLQSTARSGRDLASVGPAPMEYQQIDGYLKQLRAESAALQYSYLQALDQGNPAGLSAAGEIFARIQNDLTQAADLMMAAGWNIQ